MTESDIIPRRVIETAISLQVRPGGEGSHYTGDTLLLVPGLGCDKAWCQSAFKSKALEHDAIVSFDLPGQGDLASSRAAAPPGPGALQYLFQWVEGMYDLTAHTGDTFHFVAHSMGTIPALMAWRTIPRERRGSFIAIEGNLTTDDCFATVRMCTGLRETEAFTDDMRASPQPDLKRWGDDLMWCDPAYLLAIARDTVAMCSTGELVRRWEQLTGAHYLYGERSGYPEHHRDLFERTRTTVHEIPDSGHFPMFTNTAATWNAVAQAIRSTRV